MTRVAVDASNALAVAACAAGSTAALEDLYRQYAGSCLQHARSILIDREYAEDAVQEAYLELWRNAGRFDPRRSSVRSWLLMLTHRKAVDRVRSEQRRTTSLLTSDHDRPDAAAGPDTQAVMASLGDDARRALEALTPVKQEVLMLAYWGGYTQREIAHLTQTPLGTVKTRAASAMRDVRVLIEQEWSTEDVVT